MIKLGLPADRRDRFDMWSRSGLRWERGRHSAGKKEISSSDHIADDKDTRNAAR
jgi:hypothetical protein